MTVLKSLNFVPLPKLSSTDPVAHRRNKLITRLNQQIALAQDPNFALTRQKNKNAIDDDMLLLDIIVGKHSADEIAITRRNKALHSAGRSQAATRRMTPRSLRLKTRPQFVGSRAHSRGSRCLVLVEVVGSGGVSCPASLADAYTSRIASFAHVAAIEGNLTEGQTSDVGPKVISK